MSAPAPGYQFTVAEHSEVVRRFVEALDLSEVTAVVQDWGGPIGMGAAVADPDRYAGFVIGNTYAWPNLSPDKALLSELLGNRLLGGLLNERLNHFVGQMMPCLLQRQLPDAETAMHRGPFPTTASREPLRVLPREIRTAQPFLAAGGGSAAAGHRRLVRGVDRAKLALGVSDRDRLHLASR
ncbi:MAG: alpha/beta fold hydrolase [Jiangellales bacterium]